MTKIKTTKYDVAEHLRTPEEMAAYLEACIEEADGDAGFIAKALGDIARARGMTQVARDAGLSRESLYKALSGERSPGFDTILKVISALGLKLHAEAADIPSPEWHADTLKTRELEIREGEASFNDVDQAKKQIRKRVKKKASGS